MSLVPQLIERPPPAVVWEIFGSIPVGDSDFFPLSHVRVMLVSSSLSEETFSAFSFSLHSYTNGF